MKRDEHLDQQVLDSVGEGMGARKAARAKLRFFTIEQVADHLNLSKRSVQRFITGGCLPVYRFGGAVRICEADLHAFIAIHRTP
jgi:excisionase family DNA binding protein